MLLSVDHTTRFEYRTPPSYGLLQLRKRPQTSRVQTVVSWDIKLDGAQSQASFQDQHGNHVDLVEVESGAAGIDIKVSGKVDTHCDDGVFGTHEQAMPLWFYTRQTPLTKPGKSLDSLAAEIQTTGPEPLEAMHQLSTRIRERVTYLPRSTDVATTAEEALATGQGVCQDHTHIFLGAARQMGFAARYVSGYLLMKDRIDQDASHAWSEVHIPGLGWVGFDVSNGISPDEHYVRIAHGLDYAEIAPTKGLTIGAEQEKLIVSIQVQQ